MLSLEEWPSPFFTLQKSHPLMHRMVSYFPFLLHLYWYVKLVSLCSHFPNCAISWSDTGSCNKDVPTCKSSNVMVVFRAYHFPHSGIVVPLDAEDEKMHWFVTQWCFSHLYIGYVFLRKPAKANRVFYTVTAYQPLFKNDGWNSFFWDDVGTFKETFWVRGPLFRQTHVCTSTFTSCSSAVLMTGKSLVV